MQQVDASRTGVRWLAPEQWQPLRAAHEQRIDGLVAGHLARRRRGERHPVEDFLFTYYSLRPARLRRWQPGIGVGLILQDGTRQSLDVAAYLNKRGTTVSFVRDLLTATASRPAHLGCFGLHEWAMVYRQGADGERRHQAPLRLGEAGTDAVVETNRIRCSHFDAYRFFTPPAVDRNELRPTREEMIDWEQPGCLHANMDLYKWAGKLGEAVSSDVLADCFELARDVRELDMRASPYDLTSLGYEPIPIETPQGRTDYVAKQRAFADRSSVLRHRLLEICHRALALD